ncbi:MAG: fimbrial protein FimV, partial [Burkholderiales bacterium]
MARAAMAVAVAGVLALPLPSWAAGLGKLTVLSGLGQPLRAEIEVVSLQRGEAETLQARLAPSEAYSQANVDYAPTLQQMRFNVERRPGNRYVI